MNIVVGPEGSGTHMLTGLIHALGVEAEQRSLPYAGVWWITEDVGPFDPVTYEPWPNDTVFVHITRDPDATARSVYRRQMAPSLAVALIQRRSALDLLARLPGERFRYEDIVYNPRKQARRLAAWLGGTLPETLPEIRDENAKYREPA